MCDYSLHGIQNRLAVEGEVLVVHGFHTGSKGLASLRDLNRTPGKIEQAISHVLGGVSRECAVCIPDGAKLFVEVPLDLQEKHNLASFESVTFRQLSDREYAHRDAFEFENGAQILIQQFKEGTKVTALSLVSETPEEVRLETRQLVSVG